MKNLALTLALFVTCLPVAAQQFWHETKFGMSRVQVKTLIGPKLKMDDDNSLTLENHDFCGGPFDVNFHFKEDRLEQVSLVAGVPVGLRLEMAAILNKPITSENAQLHQMTLALLHTRISVTMDAINQCAISEYSAAYGKPIRREADSAGVYQFIRAQTSVKLVTSSNEYPITITYTLRLKGL